MNSRERWMTIAVAALLGFVAVRWVALRMVLEPLEQRDGQIAALSQQIATKQDELMLARDAEFDMNVWRQRALPADLARAQTLYQEYLRAWLAKENIDKPKIAPASPIRRGTDIVRLPFSISFRCDLGQLVRLLGQFYSSGMLHQIRRLSLRPFVETDQLKGIDVLLAIEAASMHDAMTKEGLPTAKARPLRVNPSTSVFASKNLFQPTHLAPMEAVVASDAKKSAPDHRADTVVTAALVVDGVSRVWLMNNKSQERLVISQGQAFEMGPNQGKLLFASPREVVVEVNGERGSIRLGQTLDQWTKSTETTR